MDKKAKILATLGPAIFKKNIINNLIRSGVDGFRINFSHNLTGIEKIVKIIRDCEKINSKPIAIVADLQGIKLRIGKILGNQVSLKRGDTFNFDLNKKIGSQSRVCLPYPEIFKKIKKSNKILIDDGKFVFKITKLAKNSIQTVCQNDCIIKNFKSIHIPGLEVDFDDLTVKDKRDITVAKKLGCNWIALSYVKNSKIIKQTRKLIPQDTGIIAKLKIKVPLKILKTSSILQMPSWLHEVILQLRLALMKCPTFN
jgi:pyruvate kinase